MAISNRKEVVKVARQWPESGKYPADIRCVKQDESAQFRWSYEVRDGEKVVETISRTAEGFVSTAHKGVVFKSLKAAYEGTIPKAKKVNPAQPGRKPLTAPAPAQPAETPTARRKRDLVTA